MKIISEIIGCNLKYNYKPNNESALEFVEQNQNIVSCAKHCLDSEDCPYGWVYHTGNKKVFRLVYSHHY